MKNISYLKPLVFLVLMGLALGFLASNGSAPQSSEVKEKRLDEASGLASSFTHPGILYANNDSGKPAEIFALNSKGEIKAILEFEDIKNRDWEEVATSAGTGKGSGYLYIGEIGDNNARWKTVFIYRVPEPDKLKPTIKINAVDKFEIEYEDGPRDAEAFFVDPLTQDFIIISKREEKVGVYRVAYPQSTTSVNVAQKIGTLPLTWVTGADISPDGRQILIKTYTNVYQLKRAKKTSIAKAIRGKLRPLPYIIEPQGEAVCFGAKGKGRFTLSERNGDIPLYLYYYK